MRPMLVAQKSCTRQAAARGFPRATASIGLLSLGVVQMTNAPSKAKLTRINGREETKEEGDKAAKKRKK